MRAKLHAAMRALREVFELVRSDTTRSIGVRIAVALLLVIIASVATALAPVALKLVVDGFTGQKTHQVPILVLISLYVLSQWIARTLGEIRTLVFARAERQIFRSLSERLFAHILYLPLRFHLERRTGAISQTLESGLQGYQMILHQLMFTFPAVAAEMVTIILVLTQLMQPVVLALVCGLVVCYGVIFGYAAASLFGVARAASSAHVDAHATMTDGILNYEAVKYFAGESIIQNRVRRALSVAENRWVTFFQRYALNGLLMASVFVVFLGATILFASSRVHSSRMTVGDFVLVISYLLQVVRPVEVLGHAFLALLEGAAMVNGVLAVFRETPEPFRRLGDTDVEISWSGRGQLKFEDVCLSYSPGRSALRNVSFNIPAGTTLGIVGVSGSGKSTLVRALVRFFELDRGRILLDDVPISEIPISTLRRCVAVVPQDTFLFNDSIGSNIGFGKQSATMDEIEGAARLAHLHDFILSLPDGYDTKVGEKGVKLSGGERQRISIARAAIKSPCVYVFDEATSSLDSQTEREILTSLREISHATTTIVIAHRLSTIINADAILVLEAGTVVEQGTHASLLCHNGRYAGLWAAQQQGLVHGHRNADNIRRVLRGHTPVAEESRGRCCGKLRQI